MDTRSDDPVRAWRFDELVREGVSLIPAYASAWTNHNASDPGITLVELFAYFSEILVYRALRITPDAKLNLLRLLQGNEPNEHDADDWHALLGAPSERVDDALRACVQALSRSQCAVTLLDFERAAQEAARRHLGPGKMVRALAITGADLRRGRVGQGAGGVADRAVDRMAETAGDVSVILAPERELGADALERLCHHVQTELASRCLMTTRVHVVGPVVLQVVIGCRLGLDEGVALTDAAGTIAAALRRRFGPMQADEPIAAARPFGRTLHLSEIAEVIDRADGVDWVDDIVVLRMATASIDLADARIGLRIGVVATVAEDTRLGGVVSIASRRLVRDDRGEVVLVLLQPWELVRVSIARDALVSVGSAALDPGPIGGGL